MIRRIFKTLLIATVLATLPFTIAACFEGSEIRQVIITDGSGEPVIDPVAYWRDYYLESGQLEFFDSVEEAMINDLHWEKALPNTILEIVATFENDEIFLIFFTSSDLHNKTILYSAFALHEERNGKRYYSNFFWGMRHPWYLRAQTIRCFEVCEMGRMRNFIAFESGRFRYHAINEGENFAWGLSQSANTKYLRIDGQPIDGLVPLMLEGQRLYFWYFLNLQTENSLRFRDFSQHNEGEAVITMDPE